jgi:hypothetical protein
MFTNARIRQVLPAEPGWRQMVINLGTRPEMPFHDDPNDDIEVWSIVGYAVVDEMGWASHGPYACPDGDERETLTCCEPTVVLEQMVSPLVLLPATMEAIPLLNIVNVDDAAWGLVDVLGPGEDEDAFREIAFKRLDEVKLRRLLRS